MNRPQWLAKSGFTKLALKRPVLAGGHTVKLPQWLTKSWFMKWALTKQALACGLALLLAAELVLPEPDTAPDSVTPAVLAAAPVQNDDDAVAAWGATALARPLFSASRRPVAEATTQTDFTLPRLSAIIVSGTTRRAIFATPGQKPVTVGEGGEIGPYQVTAIAPYSVRLQGPDGILTLRPQVSPPAPAVTASGNN
jgi:hypothetical protein